MEKMKLSKEASEKLAKIISEMRVCSKCGEKFYHPDIEVTQCIICDIQEEEEG